MNAILRLFAKVKMALRHRPQRIPQYARGYVLFCWTKLLSRFVFSNGRYEIAPTVRLQNIASLLATDPTAKIRVGDGSIIYEHARLEALGEGLIEIGAGSILGDITITAREAVRLGERCLTSWNVLIQDFDSHPVSQDERAKQLRQMVGDFQPRFGVAPLAAREAVRLEPPRRISIGDDVWIGANVVILKGSQIGDGSIVAAGAVVAGGEFPPRSLIAGNPAVWVKELPR